MAQRTLNERRTAQLFLSAPHAEAKLLMQHVSCGVNSSLRWGCTMQVTEKNVLLLPSHPLASIKKMTHASGLLCDVLLGRCFVVTPPPGGYTSDVTVESRTQEILEKSEGLLDDYDSLIVNHASREETIILLGENLRRPQPSRRVLPRYLITPRVDPDVIPCNRHPERPAEFLVSLSENEKAFSCSHCVVLGPYRGLPAVTVDDAKNAARAELQHLSELARIEAQNAQEQKNKIVTNLRREAEHIWEAESIEAQAAAEKLKKEAARQAEFLLAAAAKRQTVGQAHIEAALLAAERKRKEAEEVSLRVAAIHEDPVALYAAVGETKRHLQKLREDRNDLESLMKSDALRTLRGDTSDDLVTSFGQSKLVTEPSKRAMNEDTFTTYAQEGKEIRFTKAKELLTAGWSALRRGCPKKARQHWSEAASVAGPETAIGARAWAYVFEALERNHSEAERWYRRALVADPMDAKTPFNFGVMLESLGRTAEALAFFDEAASLGDRKASKRAEMLRQKA